MNERLMAESKKSSFSFFAALGAALLVESR
jgi:hypothetical protein